MAYSPATIEMCRKAEKFKEIVINTALDAVEKQMLERNDIVSRDFKILKRVKCKGNEPALMTINITNLKNSLSPKDAQGGAPAFDSYDASETQKRQKGNQDFTPKLYKEFMQGQKNFQMEKEKGEEGKGENQKKNDEDDNESEQTAAEGSILNRGIEAPKYKLTYSYHTEYEVKENLNS